MKRSVFVLDDPRLEGQGVARYPEPAARPCSGAAKLVVFFGKNDFQSVMGSSHGSGKTACTRAYYQHVANEHIVLTGHSFCRFFRGHAAPRSAKEGLRKAAK